MIGLEGKVAIVTGASSGIGKATAIELARLGCKLAIADIKSDDLEKTLNEIDQLSPGSIANSFDVSSKEEWASFRNQVIRNFKQVDIVINNAGVALGRISNEEVSYDDFEWLMNINFWGMVYGTKTFLPDLSQQEWSCVANVSSVFGLAGIAFQGPYCSSKFAIRGFTESLRMEAKLLYPNLNVLTIHPGGINTRILKDARWGRNNTDAEKQSAQRNFGAMLQTSPASMGKGIVKAIRKNKKRLVMGHRSLFPNLLPRLFPVAYTSIFYKAFKKQLENR